jgi:antirestriction protein ArdC
MKRDLYAEVSARIVAELEAGAACVYRQLKRGRNGDEVRPGWRVN